MNNRQIIKFMHFFIQYEILTSHDQGFIGWIQPLLKLITVVMSLSSIAALRASLSRNHLRLWCSCSPVPSGYSGALRHSFTRWVMTSYNNWYIVCLCWCLVKPNLSWWLTQVVNIAAHIFMLYSMHTVAHGSYPLVDSVHIVQAPGWVWVPCKSSRFSAVVWESSLFLRVIPIYFFRWVIYILLTR